MCAQPQHTSGIGRINIHLFPPRGFIAAAMDFAMMAPTKRDSKLIADLAAKRRGLRKAQMVGVRRTAAADETGLLGDRFDMLPVTDLPHRRQRQHGFVNGSTSPLIPMCSFGLFSRWSTRSANAR